MSNRNVILWLFGIQTLEKLPSRLAELFLTLEYASHAIWEGQVKSKDFTLVEKLYENQLLKHYVTQRYTSLANLGNIPIRWVIFSDSIFDTLITVVDSCRYSKMI